MEGSRESDRTLLEFRASFVEGETPNLRTCWPGFLDQLASRFDPVVRGIARQGKLHPPLRDKIRSDPDLFVSWLVGGSGWGRFLGTGWFDRTSGFLLWSHLFLSGLRSLGNCFWVRSSGTAASWFRPWAVALFLCFDFGFSSHVLLSD